LSRIENLDGNQSVARSRSSRAEGKTVFPADNELQLLRINEDEVLGNGHKRTVITVAGLGDFWEHVVVKKMSIWGRNPPGVETITE